MTGSEEIRASCSKAPPLTANMASDGISAKATFLILSFFMILKEYLKNIR